MVSGVGAVPWVGGGQCQCGLVWLSGGVTGVVSSACVVQRSVNMEYVD